MIDQDFSIWEVKYSQITHICAGMVGVARLRRYSSPVSRTKASEISMVSEVFHLPEEYDPPPLDCT